jgi:phosphoribosylanthranilate isomerase
MKTPYVGITGPVTVDEVRQVGQAFKTAGFTKNGRHIPMIGILVSYKTLMRQPTENRRYPRYEEVPGLIEAATEFGMPMIHYNSREPVTLIQQLEEILRDCEGLCKSIQLNIAWPKKETLTKVREMSKNTDFVIQLSHGAMSGLTPQDIAKRVGDYEHLADYVLIDPSGGRGKEFNLENSLAIYEALRQKAPNSQIGFAGGFTGENVRERVRTLREKLGTKDFCIDAEGGLRDKLSDKPADDVLNMSKLRSYLQEAALALV